MEASAFAAWWGAVLATVVLLWDIYKWKSSGAAISMKVLPYMQDPDDESGALNVLIELANRGDRATTLTHLAFYTYRSMWHRLIRRRNHEIAIITHPRGDRIPCEIGVGTRWTGMVSQSELLNYMEGPLIYAAISHSGASREQLCRLTLRGVGDQS